jgi:hypothetical protein
MREHVGAAVIGGNETETLGLVEPLYSTCSHDELPLITINREMCVQVMNWGIREVSRRELLKLPIAII